MYLMLCFNKEHIWCSFESRSSLGNTSYRTPVKFSVIFVCKHLMQILQNNTSIFT